MAAYPLNHQVVVLVASGLTWMRRSRGAAGGVEQVRRAVVEDSFALTSLQQLPGRKNRHMDQTGEQMIESVCETY